MRTFPRAVSLLAAVLSAPIIASAAAPAFSDVSASSPYAQAVAVLQAQNVIHGFADGTFRPDVAVNRAGALKLIFANTIDSSTLASFQHSAFTDVKDGSWYVPFAEAGRLTSVIDGPPVTSFFYPDRSVTVSEFLTMLFRSENVDVASAFHDMHFALGSALSDSQAWYYPAMRYALATSLIHADEEELLNPAHELTRGEAALLLYRNQLFRQGIQIQTLLSDAEDQMVRVVQYIQQGDGMSSLFASARAMIQVKGALASVPDVIVVQAAVKIAEGFRAIAEAYRAGQESRFDEAVKRAGDAWKSAADARALSADLAPMTLQMQALAKRIADEARVLQKQ